jgi:hypothetical protein
MEFNESFYRTQWLMAHNRLHELAHDADLAKSEKVIEQWSSYLADLEQDREVASHPA